MLDPPSTYEKENQINSHFKVYNANHECYKSQLTPNWRSKVQQDHRAPAIVDSKRKILFSDRKLSFQLLCTL